MQKTYYVTCLKPKTDSDLSFLDLINSYYIKIVGFNIRWNNWRILIRISYIDWISERFEQNYVKFFLRIYCVLFCKKLELSYVQPSKFYYSNTNKDCTLKKKLSGVLLIKVSNDVNLILYYDIFLVDMLESYLSCLSYIIHWNWHNQQ